MLTNPTREGAPSIGPVPILYTRNVGIVGGATEDL